MSEVFAEGPEEPLLGGDVTEGLVRVGDTVRRPPSAVSGAVEVVLRHLEAVGFEGAPRFLGRDGRGRDVLSFVDGEVAGRPWPDRIADEERLRSLARLLRGYHDAVAPLGLPEAVLAVPQPAPDGLPARTAGEPELVGHRDVTPENVVFRMGRAVALIDFDLLGPVTRVEELANLLLWWGPWMPEADRGPALRGADPARRARIAVDAYGLPETDRARLLPVSVNLADRSWHLMRWRAEHVGGGWARMWREGVGDRIERRRAWLEQQGESLLA
ncbi:phosphotransferase [Amnibacterium soli]|uniref:Phosphotransferase n=1 Tax=Amnibacterium soli TaxID=1282736 RepID=A0ABP8YWF0_9MICO